MTRTFTIGLRLVSEANAHAHWRTRQKRAKSQRTAVAMTWWAQGMPTARKPLEVRLTRIAPRKLDDDNLQGAFKHVRDEVAALCNFNDRDPSVRWLYDQEQQRKTYGIRVEATWADGAGA